MQALVLVGGEGTRLRPLTLTQPKPALPLVDRPFIRYMLEWLGRHGVDEVVMACGFKAEKLRAALGGEIPGGPSIRYVEEDEPLGTAGPLRLAADKGLLGEQFLALNGDVLTDLDLTALIEQHADTGAVATLALYPVDDPTHYGLVQRAGGPPAADAEPREPGGEVIEFLEKPDPAEIATDEINAGAYVLERSVLDLIPSGRAVSIEREVFPRLVREGLYGRRLDGYWMDIGTPERYLQASWDILEGRVETAVVGSGSGVLIEQGAMIAASADVGPRAVVRSGCAIRAGARVNGSVLLKGCVVGERARIEGSILAAGASVGDDATIEDGCVLGEGARIEAGVVLEAGARALPGAVVSAEVVGS